MAARITVAGTPPDFTLDANTRKIALVGDTFIQALQVTPDKNVATKVAELLNADESTALTEVLPLGHSGYGPGVYLNTEMLDYAHLAYGPEEFVVFIHLGNDLRNLSRPSDLDVQYMVDEAGRVVAHPDSFDRWHNVAHYVLTAYEPYHPIRVFLSHYMTPTLIRGLAATFGGSQSAVQAATNGVSDQAADAMAIPGVRGVITRSGATSGGHTLVRTMSVVDTPGRSNFSLCQRR